MLQFAFAASFARSVKGLRPNDKIGIQRQVDAFMLALDARQIPAGFGLKKLAASVWEIRTDLALRVIFQWEGDSLTFLLVGNHNEVRQFLKHYG